MSIDTPKMLEVLQEFPVAQLEHLKLLNESLNSLSRDFCKELQNTKELRKSFRQCWTKLIGEKGEFNLSIEQAIPLIGILAAKKSSSYRDTFKKYAEPLAKGIAGGITVPPVLAGAVPAMLGNLGVKGALISKPSSYKIGQAASGMMNAATMGTKQMLKPKVILGGIIAGVSCSISIQYLAQEFLRSLQETLKAYYELRNTKTTYTKAELEEKLSELYLKFKKEFGNTKGERYKITRATRWFGITKNHFAIAHLLLAEMGAMLGKDESYEEYTQAFLDTNEDTVRALSLLGKIKLLSPTNPQKKNVVNHKPKSDAEKEALFHDALSNFKKLFPDLIENYLKQIYEAGYLGFNKIFDSNDFYMINHNHVNGKFFKIFHAFSLAIQPLCQTTHFLSTKTDDSKPPTFNSETLDSIKINLSKCWNYIMSSNIIHEAKYLTLSELKVINYIMSFTYDFFYRLSSDDAIFKECPTLLNELGFGHPTEMLTEQQFIASEILSDRTLFEVFCEVNSDKTCENLSLEGIISSLISSEKLAKMTLKANRNWLHCLARVQNPKAKTPDRINKYKTVISKLKEYGVSFYQRTYLGATPFISLTTQDPNSMEKLMRPETHSGDHFIGIDVQMKTISDFLEYVKNNKTDRRAINLSGPPGVGKTELIKFLAMKHGFSCHEFERAESKDKYNNELQARIINFFKNARSMAKAGSFVCIFIDELDTIAAKYEGQPLTSHVNQKEIVNTIQIQIDKLKGTGVVFIGATNFAEDIKPALRERMLPIHFELPNAAIRKKIIEDRLRNYYVKPEIIDTLSECTCSWSPRSIVHFIKESVISKKLLDRLEIEDFKTSFEATRKSLTNEFQKIYKLNIQLPKLAETNNKKAVVYKYLNEDLKNAFDDIVCFLRDPQAYRDREPDLNCNTLLSGRPGTGKTFFAAQIATTVRCPVIKVNSGTLQTEPNRIEEIFKLARRFEKAVILFDEMDAIASPYSPCHTVLQSNMEGLVESDACLAIIGTTNHKKHFSEAVLSRFENQIKVKLPNAHQLKELFLQYLPDSKGLNADLKARLDQVCENFASRSTGIFAPRDVAQVVKTTVKRTTTRSQVFMYETHSKTLANDPKRRPSIKEGDLEEFFQKQLDKY